MEHPLLVESYEQVLESAENFNMKDHIKLLTSFKHWYYFEEIDSFAPSKFVGYQKMTVKKYEYYADHNSRYDRHEPFLDGRETQKRLGQKKWFAEIDSPDLRQKLQSELANFGKSLRKGSVLYTRIY